MPSSQTVVLSLTGAASHQIERSPGHGRLSIGPVVAGAPRPDVVVAVDDVLDSSTFDAFATPSGTPWPRGFRYRGNDTGFLRWSERRPIERFHWIPTAATAVDAGHARISDISVTLGGQSWRMELPAEARSFTASGNVSTLRATLASGASVPMLFFYPATLPSRDSTPLVLPHLDALGGAESVYVGAKPLRQPFDCASLLQFPHVTDLRLFGQLANLRAIADLPQLERIQLGDCPDLREFPPLTNWPRLTEFHASNIEQRAGTALRSQLKSQPLPKASVTRLRTADWFENESGLPFGEWSTANGRRAVTAFRAAETNPDPEAGIRAFARVINGLPGIETIEREDAGEAVAQLAARAGIDENVALSWLDDEREF
ncbi:hypothetical protein O7635_22940 [Asanoa sp. WMMD1127]|uniref:hypothetical protein n=1 Tax=Asanoa sp. WMMD1127 TaxID=3016107 RepID=UPI002416A08B|nr:hypothetical protein [Asanoa sp. WMMD1127]MDG4824718.1 hypothetical protein [Asanoa sp. WMMD1127]